MATLEGVQPALASAYQALVAASPYKLGITSAWRSDEQQVKLWNAYQNGTGNLAAKPESLGGPGSNHTRGGAIDIEFYDNPEAVAWVHANAAKFGIHFPVQGENWHAELIDGSGVAPNAGFDDDTLQYNITMNGEPQNPEDVLASRIESIMSMIEGGEPVDTSTAEGITEPRVDVTDQPGAAPGESAATQPTYGGPAAGGDQLDIARIIFQVGRSMGMPDRAIQIALAAGLVESELQNVNYGDRDSLGVFQQRPSQGWGTPQQVRDPTYAARKFFEGLSGVNWQSMDPGAAAQAVQRSAFPDRYGERFSEAVSIFNQLGR